ncbi:ABC-type transporter, periplasmic subunit [Rhizobium sp. CF080]|uniref:ABC transporter substrate-binding protein n=1 Tax=Rhizobium sp. (strain CF080) TaxID=1144310 RepID=UPI0002715E95|nr:ABC transporter substrate-binding protein [Rhizobium sp. CF080]EUB99514.1 ABC-type transporter, periplasmic subunit [Rhizobium sp. CF080]
MNRRALLSGSAACMFDQIFAATRDAIAEETSAFPVTVKHLHGETVIAARPRHVVSLGLNDHDFAYALGVAPVGVTEWWGNRPYATWGWAETVRTRLGAAPEIGGSRFLDYEWILALKPDLILATYRDLDERAYRKLSRIAPVVAPPRGYLMWTAPWESQLALIARALGKSAEADKMTATVKRGVEQARRTLSSLSGKTVAVADFREGQFVLWDSRSAPTRFLRSLGLGVPPDLDALANHAGWIYLSLEQVRLLDIDLLIWPNNARNTVESLEIFRSLAIYRDGRNLWLSDADPLASAALWFQSPLSILYLLDRLPALIFNQLR